MHVLYCIRLDQSDTSSAMDQQHKEKMKKQQNAEKENAFFDE